MRILKAGLVYFLLVFGAGFALAFVRVPFLVPAFGVRIAELMETPIMLAVIVWASRRLARTQPAFSRGQRLAAGILALACLVVAELAVAYFLGARSPSQYIASRDPVSGSVYFASLVFFAVAPALWSNWSGPNDSSKSTPFRGAA
jgi:hypothetical protein